MFDMNQGLVGVNNSTPSLAEVAKIIEILGDMFENGKINSLPKEVKIILSEEINGVARVTRVISNLNCISYLHFFL